MSSIVLDASALLAILNQEPRARRWEHVLPDAALSAANLSEVVTKLAEVGMSEPEIRDVLDVGMAVVPFDAALAHAAGLLRPRTRSLGLSLGDRACLALAVQMGLPALTTDRAWDQLGLPVDIRIMA
ncbi:MAG: type II toxin-antitoxin system VapC family toxin [Armatimonadota bacterium]|nr:type II toxin-antitoxin system VapC family toxin [Armatimonadota bacterium]MDR7454885.1 type II toxin-antitoxin system VapC family toxin [Armatimonadota bacterium]MDR7497024.1 type II toxin-antitoxin system VapC family toxin [Armatimonadota bacterium]MDR7510512.1 type II toxin-antitoxin system VapC family toxin [Armatimonadota bacterium]